MDDWKEAIEWDNLVSEILDEQCILIIGPDIANFEGIDSFFQQLIKHLKESEKFRKDFELGKSLVFEHDELFEPIGRASSLYTFLRAFYENCNEFEKPLKQIAELPFHLIISLLPDKRLSKIYEQMGFNFNFNYFPRTKGSIITNLENRPSKERPLIYNLMGVLDPPDAVLTFDNYFEYLQNILPENALPPLLVGELMRAKSFLFLGVHFEKWNIQLLLRKIIPYNTKENNRLKYSLLKGLQDSETFTFLARRLELDFHPVEPGEFLNELYDRFQNKGYLKQAIRKFKKSIFLSYSHTDIETINKIRGHLDYKEIEVYIDKTKVFAGEDIDGFTAVLKNVNSVLVILSKNSLRSAWVNREVLLARKNNKHLIPCSLDEYYLDMGYVNDTKSYINSRVNEINQSINNRMASNPSDSFDDLNNKRALWIEFSQTLADQAKYYQAVKVISITNQNFEDGLEELTNNILR